MIEGLCPSAHSLRPIRSSTPKIPLTPSCPEGTLRRVSLTPLLPLDTTISLLSPLFPLDTKMRGRVPPSIFPYFPVCTVHSSGYPPRFQLLARSYSKNRGRKGGVITSCVTNQKMSARRHFGVRRLAAAFALEKTPQIHRTDAPPYPARP